MQNRGSRIRNLLGIKDREIEYVKFSELSFYERIYILCIFIVFLACLFFLRNYIKISNLSGKGLFFFIILFSARLISEIFPIDYFPSKKNRAEITVSLALTLLISFVFDPFYAIIIVIITNIIGDILHQKEWYKILFNTSYLSLITFLNSMLFRSYYNYNIGFFSLPNLSVILAVGIIYLALETFTLFGLLSLLNKKNFWKFWWQNIKEIKMELFTLYPLGFLLIYLYTTNFWSALFLIPVFFAVYAASKEKVNIIHQTEDTLYALARIEDDKFPETMAHSERVRNLTELLCKKLGIGESDTTIIVKAAMLHDIGKISVPDFIIRKKDQLTQEEKKIIRNHPVKGAEILEKMFNFRAGVDFILHHHERWDGRGYPDGLKGKDIPIGSRIICITDSFDAMTSPRVYKRAKTVKDAIREIRDDIAQPDDSKQFDPEIAKVFCKMIEEIINDPEIMNNASKREKYFHPQARVE